MVHGLRTHVAVSILKGQLGFAVDLRQGMAIESAVVEPQFWVQIWVQIGALLKGGEGECIGLSRNGCLICATINSTSRISGRRCLILMHPAQLASL